MENSPAYCEQEDVDAPDLLSLHKLSRAPRWRSEALRGHARPTLMWFSRGQGRITTDAVTRGYVPNTLVLLPPHTLYGFDVGPAVHGQIIHLPMSLAPTVGERTRFLRVLDHHRQREIAALIDQIEREFHGDALGHHRMTLALVDQLLVWVERHLQGAGEPRETDRGRLMAAAFAKLVEADYAKGLTVAHFARELGITPTHLSRVCKKCCGRAAHEVLQDRIFYEARRLLADSSLPVGEIARRVGFGSAAYFSRAFARYTGQAPSTFRQLRGA